MENICREGQEFLIEEDGTVSSEDRLHVNVIK
jgi:hypothetical protein